MADGDALAGLRVIDRKTVLSLIPLSRAQLHRLEAAGRFPRAVQISPNKVAYRINEIEAWLRDRPMAVRNRTITPPAKVR